MSSLFTTTTKMAAPLVFNRFRTSLKLERFIPKYTYKPTRIVRLVSSSANNDGGKRDSMSKSLYLSQISPASPPGSRSRTRSVHVHQNKDSGLPGIPRNVDNVDGNDYGNGRLGHIMQLYEDFVGLTEVKTAQSQVVHAEKQFLEVQEKRRAMQQELMSVQTEVRSVANELEKTHRTDPGYIELVKKEHEILLVEKEMTNKIKNLDKAERDHFSLLSTFVRESHEKERARAERTKYWSVIGSVIGALIGIIGSTWNNRMRLKEMRAIVTETGEAAADYKEVATKLISNLSVLNHPEDSATLLNENENNNSLAVSGNRLQESIDKQTDAITQSIHDQMQVILSNFDDVKKILSVTNIQGSDIKNNDNVVYVGPDVKLMLEETKRDLQKASLKNMISVSVLGCLITVSLSIIIASFTKGS